MRRRPFIFFLGGVVASPLAAHAQQAAMPVIGYLHVGAAADANQNELPAPFRLGLKEAGYVEGRNVLVEYRFAEHKADRLPALATDLVRRQVAVIVVAGGGSLTALAAKAATSTIPIVVAFGGDPVKLGLAASLQRPGGNITGATFFSTALGGKRLELLCELLPRAKKIGYLRTGSPRAVTEQQMDDALTAARALGRQLLVLKIDKAEQLDAAFSTLRKERADALLIASEPFFNAAETRDKLVALSLRHAVPAIYPFRDFAVAGGLMSYGANYGEAFLQAGIYTGRVLKGEKPADLPFQQSTKFELLINLKTAKALGITVPQSVLVRADEVIE